MDQGDDNAYPGAGGFHRSEAISAVQDDEQYYGEDDDYDDLYNDVNVGEGFQQSLQRSEDPGGYQAVEEQRSEPAPSAPVPPPPPQPQATMALPETVQNPLAAVDLKVEAPVDRSGGFHEARFIAGGEPAAVPPPPQPSGVRPDLGQAPGRAPQIQGPNGNSSFHNEGFQREGASLGNDGIQRQGGGPGVRPGVNINGSSVLGVGGGLGATLFVGELHWWTTDSQLEAELCNYGQVKEIKFFDEKASGKSKGYCQVDFYDPMAAAACKEGMNGHVFNGRPCVVALASPQNVRRMGENQTSRDKQGMPQSQSQALAQKGRGGGTGPPVGGNFGKGGAGTGAGGGGGGGNWGRGGGMGGRGPMGNMRNRMGPVGGRGMMNGGMVHPPPPMMLGQAFDPTGYGAAMGRMGAGYGGFPPGPAGGHFPGMMSPFPQVVAPHVNPAFFGRGMAPGVGMWSDPNMGGWGGEEQSSYGEDAASDHQYGEGSHGKDRVPDRDRSGGSDRRNEREKDLSNGQEWSDRRYRDEREIGRDREMGRERDREWDRDRERDKDRDKERERDRDRFRDDRDRHGDNYRHRERDDEWDRGRSSRPRSKSRETEHGKRRRPSHE